MGRKTAVAIFIHIIMDGRFNERIQIVGYPVGRTFKLHALGPRPAYFTLLHFRFLPKCRHIPSASLDGV